MKKVQHLFARGYLITLEGIDGSGKTTLARSLCDTMVQDGIAAILTKEPGATPFGKEIRAMVQNPQHARPALSEFFLFAADRVAHIDQVVKPSLTSGKVVICDRMADSSVAYQGFGRGLPVDVIQTVNAIAMQGVIPDVTFYLEIDYATAHQRIMQRLIQHNEALSQFDQEKEDFFKRVARGYEYVYEQRDDVMRTAQVEQLLAELSAGKVPSQTKKVRVFYLDATKSPHELVADVVAIIQWVHGL